MDALVLARHDYVTIKGSVTPWGLVWSEQFVGWGPFLERPGKLTGPKSYFEIKVSRKIGCVLTSNEVHFVSLADNFTVQISKLSKIVSLMENKKA